MPHSSIPRSQDVEHQQLRLGPIQIRSSAVAVDLRTRKAQPCLIELEHRQLPLLMQQLRFLQGQFGLLLGQTRRLPGLTGDRNVLFDQLLLQAQCVALSADIHERFIDTLL